MEGIIILLLFLVFTLGVPLWVAYSIAQMVNESNAVRSPAASYIDVEARVIPDTEARRIRLRRK